MIARLQQAILGTAALLVPGCLRAEWLAEWRSELWHARPALGPTRATAFCLGAFLDALWLCRNAPRRPMREIVNLDSPTRCLGFLGALAAASLLIAYQIPNIPTIRARPADHLFLVILLFACAILPTSTSLSLGEYRANRHVAFRTVRLRPWIFLAAKIALILLVSEAPMRYVAHNIAANPDSHSAGVVINVLFWGIVFALRWSLCDQRQRCPVCLRTLGNPVRVGEPAGYFLEWNCTELMCLRGHGMLYVPECPTSWFDTPRWFYMDSY